MSGSNATSLAGGSVPCRQDPSKLTLNVMALLYKSIAQEAHTEQIINKSRFIAHAYPAESREEAEAVLAAVRAEYRDATHNVPAMVIGDKQQLQWASDDGEPSGTSGAPMLQMIVKEELTNLIIIVTRYFGGIKLGPGGLVRAYTSSAKQVIEAAGIKEYREIIKKELKVPYNLLDRIQYNAIILQYAIESTSFADCVSMVISYEPEQAEQIQKFFKNLRIDA